MLDSIEVEVFGKQFTVNVEQQDYPDSPRNWDNLGTMVCQHHRYDLGDEDLSKFSPYYSESHKQDFANYVLQSNELDFYPAEKYIIDGDLSEEGVDIAWRWIDKHLVVLPLYLYDHSGISMNTGGYSCSWDSGQVGYIFVSKAKARKEFGVKRLSQVHLDSVVKSLKAEVSIYSDYISGSVYEYRSEDLDIQCGGFFGYDHNESGLIESATADVTYAVKSHIQRHLEHLKHQIQNRNLVQKIDVLRLRKPLSLAFS